MNIWLERDSLEKLVAYSEHPLYSQCITTIRFATWRLNPYIYNRIEGEDGWTWHPRNARDIGALYQQANTTIDEESARSCPFEKNMILWSKHLVQRLEYQKIMEMEELDVSLLSKAFEKLPRLAHVAFDNGRIPYESKQLTQDGFDLTNPGPEWRRHVVQVGLKALANAGCKPTSIIILNDGSGYRYGPSWVFDDLDVVIPQAKLRALVQNLRQFRVDGTADLEIGSRIQYEGAIARFLENASLLETIIMKNVDERHGLIHPYRGDTVRPSLGYLQYRRLRTIVLVEMLFRERDLATWLLMHSDSLKTISFCDVTLTQGQWDSFLDTLRSKSWPRLSHIDLNKVTVEDSAGKVYSWDWANGSRLLIDYIQKKSDTNPYQVYPPDRFPRLFSWDTDSESESD